MADSKNAGMRECVCGFVCSIVDKGPICVYTYICAIALDGVVNQLEIVRPMLAKGNGKWGVDRMSGVGGGKSSNGNEAM